ncbi:MAG: hypothetical protein NZ765_00950 [Anaerolineae bacterium]|nr:hypothetical protein [Anaerolineae bacterium]MDW8069890.1 hypothetical protein [Anaerolineae bacterium]
MRRGTISRLEWKWWALGSVALILLTGVPYGLGWLMETPEYAFSGFFVAVEDGNNYLAAMYQGAAGRWRFYNPYTPEPHVGLFAYTLYLVLGKLARLADLPLALVLHLARAAAIPFLLLAVYRFVAHFTPWHAIRRLSWFLVAMGGGLGWLWVLAGGTFAPGAMPTDLWVPDASAFLTMLTFPHLVLAQASLLWLAISGLRLLHHPNASDWLGTALAALVLSLIHPYSPPILIGLLTLHWAWRGWRSGALAWQPWLRLGVASSTALPVLVHMLWVLQSDPVLRSWLEQNVVRSPHPLFYLLGFGLLCPLALVGLLQRALLRRHPDVSFVVLWVLLIPLLLYIPSNLQRRFLNGYQVPLVLMAVCGLVGLLDRIPPRWRSKVVLGFKTFSTLSNLMLLGGFIVLVVGRPPLVFNARAVLAAMDWLAARAEADAVVLAAYDTGNLLPTRALVRSFVGHGPQSVHAEVRREQVRAFFSGALSPEARRALLRDHHVRYIFYGPSERALGDVSPADLPDVRRIYHQDAVQIYEVCYGVPTCQWCVAPSHVSAGPLRVR